MFIGYFMGIDEYIVVLYVVLMKREVYNCSL